MSESEHPQVTVHNLNSGDSRKFTYKATSRGSNGRFTKRGAPTQVSVQVPISPGSKRRVQGEARRRRRSRNKDYESQTGTFELMLGRSTSQQTIQIDPKAAPTGNLLRFSDRMNDPNVTNYVGSEVFGNQVEEGAEPQASEDWNMRSPSPELPV